MENEENGVVDTSNQQEEVVLETTKNDESEEGASESIEDLKAQLAKKDEIINNQKIRAEKAEKIVKSTKTEQVKESPKSGDLGTKDLYALMEAKVAQDDIDDVVEYAKFKNITVQEALKSSVVKTLLSEKAEQRNVAEATNVGNSKRGSTKISDDVLLSKASKGELPEDYNEMMRLEKIRKGIK